ncbi:hypothetical protein ACNKHX_20170 [Shigella flexneri]
MVRVTDHPLAVAFLPGYEKAAASTSANRPGLPPCRRYQKFAQQFWRCILGRAW